MVSLIRPLECFMRTEMLKFLELLAMKTTEIAWISTFFSKKRGKVLVVRKKVVPLHPQSREMHF